MLASSLSQVLTLFTVVVRCHHFSFLRAAKHQLARLHTFYNRETRPLTQHYSRISVAFCTFFSKCRFELQELNLQTTRSYAHTSI